MQNAVCPHVFSTDLPPRVTLASTCSAPVHFILSGHGSRPRLHFYHLLIHVRRTLPSQLSQIHCCFTRIPRFFFFSPQPLVVSHQLPFLLQEVLMRFLFGGEVKRGPRTVLLAALAACQARDGALSCRKTDFFFFYMSHCKVVS